MAGRHTRRVDATRNRERVLAAARDLLAADPTTPMSAVSREAGVGMGTVYRHFEGRDALLQAVCRDAMLRLDEIARRALERAEKGTNETWPAFADFVCEAWAAGAASYESLAGTFPVTEDLLEVADSFGAHLERLVRLGQQRGAVRGDVTAGDVVQLLERARAVDGGQRSVVLSLDGFRAPGLSPLPGPAPSWTDKRRAWASSAAAAPGSP